MVVYSFYIFDRHGMAKDPISYPALMDSSSRLYLQAPLASKTHLFWQQSSSTSFGGKGAQWVGILVSASFERRR